MKTNSNRTIRRSIGAVAAVGALAVAGVGGYALAGSDGPAEDTRVATVATQQQTGGPQGHHGQQGQGGQGHGGQGQGGAGQQAPQGEKGHGLEVPAPAGTLSAEEAETLSMMREEERLAHDLYVALGEAWPDRRFDNISAAEARHGEATATLLANHDLPDPSVGSTPGVYDYPELQELYDDWLERGLTSKSEALAVGAELERRDIADLEAAMAATEQPDLDAVYEHLRDGSEKHLAAFERG
jgi:hypothetical protein